MKTAKKKPKKKLKQPIKEFYTLPEAAQRKGVSRQAVWQAVNENRLIAQRFGNFFLVGHSDLMQWQPGKVKG